MTKILIVGDSFASLELAGTDGWPKKLADCYEVTNVAAPGIGEYKILQNLKSQRIAEFDLVIVSHTSPNRIHCEVNPLYPKGHLYSKSDVIFADAENKQSQFLIDFFKFIFDPEYYQFIHTCCCAEIDQLTRDVPTIHMTNFDWNGLYQFGNLINFYDLWLTNRGTKTHYNEHGNHVILETLVNQIKKIT